MGQSDRTYYGFAVAPQCRHAVNKSNQLIAEHVCTQVGRLQDSPQAGYCFEACSWLASEGGGWCEFLYNYFLIEFSK